MEPLVLTDPPALPAREEPGKGMGFGCGMCAKERKERQWVSARWTEHAQEHQHAWHCAKSHVPDRAVEARQEREAGQKEDVAHRDELAVEKEQHAEPHESDACTHGAIAKPRNEIPPSTIVCDVRRANEH